jgi:hypothetical protein
MALNSSGPISLGGATTGQSINLELGNGATDLVALNDTEVRTLAGITSGVITMPTDFYGKSSGPTVVKWWLATNSPDQYVARATFLEAHPSDTNVYGIFSGFWQGSQRRTRMSYFKFDTSTYTIAYRLNSPHSTPTDYVGGGEADMAWDTTQNGIIMLIGGGNQGGTGIRSRHYCLVDPSTGAITQKNGQNGTFFPGFIPKYTNGIYTANYSGPGSSTNYKYFSVMNGFNNSPGQGGIRILGGTSSTTFNLNVGPTATGNQLYFVNYNNTGTTRWPGFVKLDANLQIDASSYGWFNGYGVQNQSNVNTSYGTMTSKIPLADENHFYCLFNAGINSGFNNGAANGEYKSVAVVKVNRNTKAIVWQKGIYNLGDTVTQFGLTQALIFVQTPNNNAFTSVGNSIHLSDGGILVLTQNTGGNVDVSVITRFDASGNHVWSTKFFINSTTAGAGGIGVSVSSISRDQSSYLVRLAARNNPNTANASAVLNLPMDGSSNFTVAEGASNLLGSNYNLTVTSSTTPFHTYFDPGITIGSTQSGTGALDNAFTSNTNWTNNFGYSQTYFAPATITSGTI